MITFEEAKNRILKRHKLSNISSCLDFGNFWLFSLVPFYAKKDDSYPSGRTFPAIDKKTGKEFSYDITSDLKAFNRAKEVKV